MKQVEAVAKPGLHRALASYIDVLKPRETLLLTFIGLCAAFIATGSSPSVGKFILVFIAVLLGSAGANGLTNYLDRDVDARMRRTCRRSLPAQRIHPPEKVLPLTLTLVVTGLGLAWWLHPLCFAAGLVGVITAVTFRKRVSCAFPQGVIAGSSPVLIGWFAFEPNLGIEIVFLCILIATWIPLHVWSVMAAHQEDYMNAGITYFPISWQIKDTVKVLLGLSAALCIASLALYFVSDFGFLYLATAIILGAVMLYASIRLVVSSDSNDAWRLYKLSSFPYLGMIFLAMCLDLIIL